MNINFKRVLSIALSGLMIISGSLYYPINNDIIPTRLVANAVDGLIAPLEGNFSRTSVSSKTNGYYCDYVAASGTPVYASCDGNVEFRQTYAVNYDKLASYANHFVLTSADGQYLIKGAHLSSFNDVNLVYTSSLDYPCGVKEYTCKTITIASRNVRRGDLIGYSGETGNAHGSHLHLEVYRNGSAVDPLSVLEPWSGSINPQPAPDIDTSWVVPASMTPNITSGSIPACDIWGNPEPNRWIDYNDECYIDAVYVNGMVHLKYPSIVDGERWAYAEKKYFDLQPIQPNPPSVPGAGQTIPNGDYWIGSAMDMNYFLDIPGVEPAASGTNVTMWTCDDNMPSQYDVWTVTYKGNGFYKIKQRGGNVCLDVAGASTANDANVQVHEDNDSIAQEWSIAETGIGYTIQARCNGYNLDVQGAVVENGTNVMTHTCHNDSNQRFVFIPADSEDRPLADGIYVINSSSDTSFCLDGSGAQKDYKNGTNVAIWKQAEDTYRFTYVGKGWYSITEYVSGLALDVDNSGLHNFADNSRNVMLCEKNGGRNQLWRIQKSSDGFYSLTSKISGYCLDLTGNNVTNGANVAQYPPNGSPAQKWQIVNKTYTLTVDPNGGKYDNSTVAVAKSPRLIFGGSHWWHIGESGNAVKEGSTLKGYFDAKTGGTKVYNADGTCTNEGKYFKDKQYIYQGNLTVYAQWDDYSLTIHYNANGGTIAPNDDYAANESGAILTAKDQKPVSVVWKYAQGDKQYGLFNATTFHLTKQGYAFCGWSISKDSETIFDQDDTTVISNDLFPFISSKNGEVTLYARWKAVESPFKGNGTKDDPYRITNKEDLVIMRDLVNDKVMSSVFGAAYYRQTSDIDLEGVKWIPIGKNFKDGVQGALPNFRGFYDGDYHSITGLYVSETDKFAGLFGHVGSNGIVENLEVYGTVSSEGASVGGIAGEICNATIRNCAFYGDVHTSGNVAGGILGYLWQCGTVESCYHNGIVANSGEDRAGGVVGTIQTGDDHDENAYVKNCYHVGTIEGPSEKCGAVVGFVTEKTVKSGRTYITNCYGLKSDSVATYNGKATEAEISLLTDNQLMASAEDLGRSFVIDPNGGYPILRIVGDANNDRVLSVADVVILQRWLLADPNVHIADWIAVDMCEDDKLNVFDLCLLKRKLLNS